MEPVPPGGAFEFDIHHPHDYLVKFVLGVSANMADFLATRLPGPLAAPVDWNALRIEPGTFISDELKASYSDILVSAPFLGQELRVYSLVEHKSAEVEDTMAQILELLTKVTLQLKRESAGKGFAPVLALVLHHGERSWKSSTQMFDHYLLPEPCKAAFRSFLLGFQAVLVDLKAIPMEAIHNTPPVEALLKALKAVKEGLEEPFLDELKREAVGGELKGYLATLLLYLLCAGKGVSKERVLEIAKSTREAKLVSDVMTGAEILREEGKLEGIREGEQTGLEKGRLIGQIIFIQEMLGREPAQFNDLAKSTVPTLQQELAKLRAEWLSRR